MKKQTLKVFILLFLSFYFTTGNSQVQIFYENCGSPETYPIPLNENNWLNTNVVYSGSSMVEIRTNQQSTYPDGNPFASGAGNIYLNGGPSDFTITGINTQGYQNITLSFGVFGKFTNAIQNLRLQYSTGGLFSNISNFMFDYTNEEKTWVYITVPKELTNVFENVENLSIRFRIPVDTKIRIDDILLTGTLDATLPPTIDVNANLSIFETSPSVSPITQTITLEGHNLTDDISLSLPTNSSFNLSTNTIEKTQGSTDINITYSPTQVGYNVDTLLISTPGMLYPLAVKLFGKCNFLKPETPNLENVSEENSFEINWNPVVGAEKYLLNITKIEDTGIAENIIYSEDFSKMIETDDLLIGERIDADFIIDNYMNSTGWTGEYVYNGSDDDFGDIPGVVRIGKKEGGKGYIITPTIKNSIAQGNVYLKIKVRLFSKNNSKEEAEIKISHASDGFDFQPLATLENLHPDFHEFILKVENATIDSKFKFESIIDNGDLSKNNRFILEDLQVMQNGIEKNQLILNQLVENTSTTITDLDIYDTYEISIRAYDTESTFASPESNILTIRPVDLINSVKKNKMSFIYTTDKILFIDLLNDEKIEIFSILGEKILTRNGRTGKNEISTLKNNHFYIVKIASETFKIKL